MIAMSTSSTKSRSNSLAPQGEGRSLSKLVQTGGFAAPQTLAPVADHEIGHPPRWEGDLSTDELLHRSALFPALVKRTAIQYP
jgi:hypothetical protein